MRNIGTLSKWNDNRGFGFILPNQTDVEIFVHITAFPRDGIRPTIGETLSFETALNKGKLCAVKVQRPTGRQNRSQKGNETNNGRTSGYFWSLLLIALTVLAAAAYYGYSTDAHSIQTEPSSVQTKTSDVRLEPDIKQSIQQSLNEDRKNTIPSSAPVVQQPSDSVSTFRCDGRQYCSQMTSCEEATFFLNNCPGVKMDGGDGQGRPDGVPCEKQWCPEE